jgi:hypothetical protein
MSKYKIVICLILFACFLQQSKVESASLQRRQLANIFESIFGTGTSHESPEPEWSSLKFEEIKPAMKEKLMKPSEFYAKLKECVKKCLSQNISPSHSLRDKCIAKNCDIY